MGDQPATAVRGESLRQNFLWMFLGNGTYAVCLAATLVILAKLGSAREVGQFNLGFAITGPIVLLLNLNLRALKATDARGEYEFSTYLSLRIVCAVVGLVAAAAIALVFGYEVGTRNVILAIAFAKALESVSDIVYGLLQKHEKMGWIAAARVARGALTVAAVSGVFVWTGDVAAATGALAVAWLVVLLAIDLPAARRVQKIELGRDVDLLRRLFRSALPLGAVMMLININTNVPIYFLSWEHGESIVGYYSAINYIGVVASTVAVAIGQAAAPRLGRLYAAGQVGEARRLLRKLVLLGLGMGAAGSAWAYLLGPETLELLFTKEYAEFSMVFQLLMLGYGLGFGAAFVGVALTAQRRLAIMMPINLVTLAINVGLCWLLVPAFGMTGAAWSVVTALGFKLCANFWAASRIATRDR